VTSNHDRPFHGTITCGETLDGHTDHTFTLFGATGTDPIGDRVLRRGDMLRYSEEGGSPAARRSPDRLRLVDAPDTDDAGSSLPDVVDLRDRPASCQISDADPTSVRRGVLRAEPASTIARSERQAIGRGLGLLGHSLDAVALSIPFLVYGARPDVEFRWTVGALFVVIGTVLLWPTHRRGRQVIGPSEGLLSVATRVGVAPVITAGIVSIRSWNLTTSAAYIDLTAILQVVVFTLPLVLLGRVLTVRATASARRRGYDLADTIVVGTGPVGREVVAALTATPRAGLVPCGYVDGSVDGSDDDLDLPLIGRPEDLPEILQVTGVHHVVLAFGSTSEAELVRIVRRCHDASVQFYAVPRLFELGVSHDQVGHEVDGLPLVSVRSPATAARHWPAKRAFDLVAAVLLLFLTAPVILVCAVAVKLTSPGPVFFRQVRIGVGGRRFEILKFRTMVLNEESAVMWSTADDDRVTVVGRFLRPTHLDELPQLVNVLRGEMSLVGPRPERPHFVEQFGSEIDDYHDRHRVPAGITGWAQVNGYWGDTSIERRVRLDNRYIENWSLWRDLVIGLRTIPTLFGKRR